MVRVRRGTFTNKKAYFRQYISKKRFSRSKRSSGKYSSRRMLMALRRQVYARRPEVKYTDNIIDKRPVYNRISANTTLSLSDVRSLMTMPTQGLGDQNRIGDSIKPLKCWLRIELAPYYTSGTPAVTINPPSIKFRVLIVTNPTFSKLTTPNTP